jgi:hypothetical protein
MMVAPPMCVTEGQSRNTVRTGGTPNPTSKTNISA